MVSVTSMVASRATTTSASKRSMASERAAARPPVAASRSRPASTPASGLAARGLEADLGGLALRFTAELEELARREAEGAGDQVRGELRDARVQVAHHRVVVAARVLHRVLDLAEARLELREVLRGAELRVGLGEREDLPQGLRERSLGLGLGRRSLRRHGAVAGADHGLQGGALVAGVSLHRLDQVGDQVVAALQLHV